MNNRLTFGRRQFLSYVATTNAAAGVTGFGLVGLAAAQEVATPRDYPDVVRTTTLQFPRDFGAHPNYRIEWWYLTAWLDTERGPLGLQLTFFRSRTPFGRSNPSRFAPRQLLFAHAAVADPARGKLLHAEQAWRGDPVNASASTTDTAIGLGPPARRWTMQRRADDVYVAQVLDPAFNVSLTAAPPPALDQPILQGDQGFSLKGVHEQQASHYYSRPQLQMSGVLTLGANSPKKNIPFTGTGWFDHEWSSELLDTRAQGWDWIGLNFSDGTALMAFQMRSRDGPPLRTTARFINADGQFRDTPAQFTAIRYWNSPRTDARYPVTVRIQAGPLDLLLEPLFDDQELDSRRSTGTVYWEGAVSVSQFNSNKIPAPKWLGRGYLEMTGYAGAISF